MKSKSTMVAIAIALIATQGLIACGVSTTDTSDGGTCTGGMGTLTVNVTGLPSGVNASVLVTGTSGSQTVTANASIPLTGGAYTVSAAVVTQADPTVRKAFDATVSESTATVCDGQTSSINADYALIPTSNTVWVGNGTGGSAPVLGFASANVQASGSPAATVAATTKGSLPGAFDKKGNVWFVDRVAGEVGLYHYPAASFVASGPKTADIVLTSDVLQGGTPGPVDLAFDKSGNLWVAVGYADKVVMFTPAQIATSGAPTPTVSISAKAPAAVAFDGSGDLWVGSQTDNAVEKFAAARLAVTTTDPADVTITAKSSGNVVASLTNPVGLAFDKSNNLWVDFNGSIARLDAATLTTSSDSAPSIIISADVAALTEGMAFDESGALWLAYSAGEFGRFGATQLTTGGSKQPEIVISSTDVGYAGSFAFFPAPAGLPLYSSLP